MNIDQQIKINADQFLQTAHIALLYRMLAVAGFEHGTPAFDQLRREATMQAVMEGVERYVAMSRDDSWIPSKEPQTATGAQIAERDK